MKGIQEQINEDIEIGVIKPISLEQTSSELDEAIDRFIAERDAKALAKRVRIDKAMSDYEEKGILSKFLGKVIRKNAKQAAEIKKNNLIKALRGKK